MTKQITFALGFIKEILLMYMLEREQNLKFILGRRRFGLPLNRGIII